MAVKGRRRHSRLRLSLAARLITLERTSSVVLLDLSIDGARLALSGPLGLARQGVLKWLDFETFADIRWIRDGRCGLVFDRPLVPEVLVATRDYADVAPLRQAERVRDDARAWVEGRTLDRKTFGRRI